MRPEHISYVHIVLCIGCIVRQWKPVSKSYVMFSKQKKVTIYLTECVNVQHINKVIFGFMCVWYNWLEVGGRRKHNLLFFLLCVPLFCFSWSQRFKQLWDVCERMIFAWILDCCVAAASFFFVFLFISHFFIHKSTYLVFLEQLIQSLSFHNGIQITFHFTFTQIVAYVTERSELNQIHKHRFAIRIDYWILFGAKPSQAMNKRRKRNQCVQLCFDDSWVTPGMNPYQLKKAWY